MQIGCHNINWVTPEHVVPQSLEALSLAVERGLRLPIVCNTSAYVSSDSLALMDGMVDIYMPDLKLASSERSRRYVGKREYFAVASRNILEMRRQVGNPVLDEQVGPETYVNLMGQYRPAGRAERFAEINRRPYPTSWRARSRWSIAWGCAASISASGLSR